MHPYKSLRAVGFALLASVSLLGAKHGSAANLPIRGDFQESFSSYDQGLCYSDGLAFGPWTSDFNGYGCTEVTQMGGDAVLHEQPLASSASDETHASFVTGLPWNGDLVLDEEVYTDKQLRTGSDPNPWEVAWAAWNVTDKNHFYYFIPKTNGWELGKTDPAYEGGQRFLATGSDFTFPTNQWYKIHVVQKGSTIEVSVDGQKIVSFTDEERPYTDGKIAFYNEDASAYFRNVQLTSPDAEAARLTLSGISPDNSNVTLAWNKPTHSKQFLVLRNGTAIGQTSGTTFEDRSVAAGQTYSYTVQSLDGTGQTTEASNSATVPVPFYGRNRGHNG